MHRAIYQDMRDALDEIPVIETHVHYTSTGEPQTDCMPIILGYLKSDLRVCAGPDAGDLIRRLVDSRIPFKERYTLFEKYYRCCAHTAYARAMVRSLELCWGLKDAGYASLCQLNERLTERTNEYMQKCLRRANVRAQVADIFEPRFFNILSGRDTDYTPLSRFAFPLPAFHRIYDNASLESVGRYIGAYPESLDELADGIEGLLRKAKVWGAVCIKDQSAYFRTLDYGHPTYDQAEQAFNALVSHPMEPLGFQNGKVLDDWLMQRCLTAAGRLSLPVQIHTGLQDRIAMHDDRNGGDIRAVNAALMIPTMERHRRVRFDLFHANWPYMDEILYIAKNFPNAVIDLCWTHAIDPHYSIELMKRAVQCLPLNKVLGFGGDAFFFENGIGYLALARDNIARAMTELVEDGWLTQDDALSIAHRWLYDNPAEYYGIQEADE